MAANVRVIRQCILNQVIDSTLVIVGAYLMFATLVATPLAIVTCKSTQRAGAGVVQGHLLGAAAFGGVVVGLFIAAIFTIQITAGAG
jgi:uncharacterized membrane-anchored protein YitT (DUF2179 family)